MLYTKRLFFAAALGSVIAILTAGLPNNAAIAQSTPGPSGNPSSTPQPAPTATATPAPMPTLTPMPLPTLFTPQPVPTLWPTPAP